MLHNPIVARQAPPPGNLSSIIWTDPNQVPMFIPLTPEQYAALPHPNYAPKLLITIWVLLGLAGSFLALRLYCKCSRHRGAWWDDWFLVGSFVSFTSQAPLFPHSPQRLLGEQCGGALRDTDGCRGLDLPHG